MQPHDYEPRIHARDELNMRRVTPTDYFCGVTLIGALITISASAIVETLFLVATFGAMLVLRRLRLPTDFELAFAIGIVLQGWGNALLLFERIGWYDKVVHFLTPLLVVPALYLLLVRSSALPNPSRNAMRYPMTGVLIVATALGIGLATLWELVEGTADRWFGANFAHGYYETIDDLYASALGSVAAAALLAWRFNSCNRELITAIDRAPPVREAD